MFYNCHIHTFTSPDIPDNFLPLGLVRWLARTKHFDCLARFLNNLNRHRDDDVLDRYVKFCSIGREKTQKDILEECIRFYPTDMRYVVLSMDMKYMGAGNVPRRYEDQLTELSALSKKYSQVIPIVHIDPRREKYFDLMKKCVEEWGYRGVKIYPPIGVFPYDEALDCVYDYCLKNDLPVMAHCSYANPVYFMGKQNEFERLMSKARTEVRVKGDKRRVLCGQFADPKNWEFVLEKYPKLKLCLAHFGSAIYWKKYIDDPNSSDGNWFKKIITMIPAYENLYADISSTLSQLYNFSLLKVLLADQQLKNKILFGSDFYMVECDATERRFSLDLRAFIGEENFKLIATDNPEKYFFSK